jgi:hypothetical protein
LCYFPAITFLRVASEMLVATMPESGGRGV